MGQKQFFRYVMETGKAWRGKIGKAVISIDLSGLRDFGTFKPAGYVRRGHTVTCTFEGFEPQEDVVCSFWPGYSYFVLDGNDLMAAEDPFHNLLPLSTRGPSGRIIAPYIGDDVLMVPARTLGYLLGSGVTVEPRGRRLAIRYLGTEVLLTAGSGIARAGKEEVLLPRAPELREGYFIVPLAAVGRAVGTWITFDPDTGRTHIVRLPTTGRST